MAADTATATVLQDSLAPGLKELDSIWEYIGYPEDQRMAKVNCLADAMQRCLFEFITAENEHRISLEGRIESLKRKAAQVCQSLRLPPYFPPRGLASLALIARLEEHIAQYEVEINARQAAFAQRLQAVSSLCRSLGLDADAELQALPSAGPRPDEFIPSEQDLSRMQKKLDDLQARHDQMLTTFNSFCDDIRRIASDIEYLPETRAEADILNCPTQSTASTSKLASSAGAASTVGWPLTESGMAELAAWRLRLVKHKAMLVGTCDELRGQVASLRRRLGLPDETDGGFQLSRHQGYRPSDLTALQSELASCQQLRAGPLAAVYAASLRREAEELAALCFASVDDLDGGANAPTDALEARVEQLRERYEASRELFDTVRHYQLTWEAYMDVEQRMKDPSIFSNRGGILLKTEKEKKHLLKELPRVEARVSEQLRTCRGADRFRIDGRSFEQHVRHLWEAFRAEKEAAKVNRRVSRASIAGSNSVGDLSLQQQQQPHQSVASTLQTPLQGAAALPRKSLAPCPVSAKR